MNAILKQALVESTSWSEVPAADKERKAERSSGGDGAEDPLSACGAKLKPCSQN